MSEGEPAHRESDDLQQVEDCPGAKASARVEAERQVSNDLPIREAMSLEKPTISNMWEIARIVDVL